MSTAKTLAPAALIVVHEVSDWNRWKTAFDADEGKRKAAGIVGHHINRGFENPNLVSAFLALTDLARAKAFAASDALRQVMVGAGVKGPPELLWMKPVSENILWDRELPAMLVTHPVADFAKWFAVYQSVDGLQRSAGIIGHAVNQMADDPNSVVVYHQAETLAALRAFVATPELKAAMEKGGVTAPPRITFHTGGWARMY